MKQVILYLGVAFCLIACETGTAYKEDTTPSMVGAETKSLSISDLIDAKEPIKQESYFDADAHLVADVEETFYSSQEFRGGVLSDGLNVKAIRKGTHRNYERLVFDIQTWSAYGSMEEKKVHTVGSYNATYNPSKKLITVVLNGYRSFTAPFPTFSRESVIENIYFEQYKDDSGYKFHIKLKESTEVKVFDLKNPARMVFDIKSI